MAMFIFLLCHCFLIGLQLFNDYQVASTFREKKIPCDVIWMDIDYMQGFKCFTFDKVVASPLVTLVDPIKHVRC